MILASALTLYLLIGIIGPLRLLSFLISYNASDSPFAGAWFNFGYFAYLIGVLAIGMMAMIYRYFEHTLHMGYDRATRVLTALNFVFMNAGIIIATWTMMIAGYVGGVAQMLRCHLYGEAKDFLLCKYTTRSLFHTRSLFWLL